MSDPHRERAPSKPWTLLSLSAIAARLRHRGESPLRVARRGSRARHTPPSKFIPAGSRNRLAGQLLGCQPERRRRGSARLSQLDLGNLGGDRLSPELTMNSTDHPDSLLRAGHAVPLNGRADAMIRTKTPFAAQGIRLLAVTVALHSCAGMPSTVTDTEKRVFRIDCTEGKACSPSQVEGMKSAGARQVLATSSHVLSVCDAAQAGYRPAPATCRPISCESDADCPIVDSTRNGTCRRGICTNPLKDLVVGDAVSLCLAGTGIGQRTPEQAEKYALGLNCGDPCRVPAACRGI